MLKRTVTLALAVLSVAIAPAVTTAQSPAPLHGDLPTAMRGVLGIEVSRDSLASVVARLGPATAWRTGDGAEATVSWCYRMGSTADSPLLLISSNSEMGGAGHIVEDILLSRPRSDTLGARCGMLPRGRSPETTGGLRLGLAPDAVVRLLGAPLLQSGDSIVYRWETELPLDPHSSAYAHWNTRRQECFGGRAPFITPTSSVVVHFDSLGASQILLERYAEAIC